MEDCSDKEPPRNLRYILFSALTFLLGWSLLKSRAPNKDPREPIYAGKATAQDNAEAKPHSRLITPADSFPTHKNSKNSKHGWPNWGQLVQLGIFLATSIYASITYGQWRTQIRTMRISHRAWMAPATAEMQDFEVGKEARLIELVWNNGPTPAKEAIVEGIVEHWLSSQKVPSKTEFKDKPTQWKGDLVRSGGAFKMTFKFMKLDEEILRQLHSEALKARINGKVFYDDIFGHSHWVTFCSEYEEETGGFTSCDEGTSMDADQE